MVTAKKPDEPPLNESCNNCEYWEDDLCCHRYPPLVVLRSPTMQTHITLWPSVEADDWCGEWLLQS